VTIKKQIRCAIYTRKSTEEGLEQEFNSLDAQREAGEAYIASQRSEGWICGLDRYDDGGFSGGNLDRPALKSLLSDVEANKIDVVVVYKIDRLSRSLMDFARLVEIFDRKAVTFVSVTQSFNTTTSMGRLTLNILLSFAQFEREIIGERVKDKIAASKKKGMWMGGSVPLGYDVKDRKLVINEAEAGTIRMIFRRYVELGCVRALRDDLSAKNVTSKSWVSSTGRSHRGVPFQRGALYWLLRNRIYLGEITHKDKIYGGEHEAIVARELYDKVQKLLSLSAGRQRGHTSHTQEALLTGLIFDETGQAMTPTYSRKADGRQYHYYVSQAHLQGLPIPAGLLTRVPAAGLENLVRRTLAQLRLPTAANTDAIGARSFVKRVTVQNQSLVLSLDREACLGWWRSNIPGARGFTDADLIAHHQAYLDKGGKLNDKDDHFDLTLSVRAKFRGGEASMLDNPGAPATPKPDAALITALARAHQWKQLLLKGEVRSIHALAKKVGHERRHVGQTLALAFLNPALTKAILKGEQPTTLRLTQLLDAGIPWSWRKQQSTFQGCS